jgi:type 2 lantibiotic biosynthesis protein LanM
VELSIGDELRIVAAAASLVERLHQRRGAAKLNHPDVKTTARMDRWCEVVARGEIGLFVERLALDGLDLDGARQVLSSQFSGPNEAQLPWVDTLRAALRESDSSLMPAMRPGYAQETPFPFEEAYFLFLIVARRRLRDRVGRAHELLSGEAHAQLEHMLLRRLSQLCGRPLQLQFSVFRARQSRLAGLVSSTGTVPGRGVYQEFISRLVSGGLLSLFYEYPVLAKLTAIVCDQWVSFIAEFIRRLEEDLPDIKSFFTLDEANCQVARMRPAFSDPHNYGRSVITFEFGSGAAVVYKPKDVGLERQWTKLLSWLNDKGIPLRLKELSVLERPGYGWVEFVAQQACKSGEEAKRYYQRAGMLLALVYTLQGTDFHQENLIASGEYPVLVDLETLMYPVVREGNRGSSLEAYVEAQRQLEHSVLRSGLLPAWDIAPGGSAYDMSGLGGVHEWSFRRLVWKNINTDGMILTHETGTAGSEPNAPKVGGRPLNPGEFVDDIVDGFRSMYRWVLDNRAALTAREGPLTGLARQRVRFVFRPTKAYASVRDKLSHPKYFRCGSDRSIEMDVLTEGILDAEPDLQWWRVLKAEQEALERLDIPYFAVRADSRHLPLPSGRTVPNFFEKSAWEQLSSNLAKLTERDLEQQIAFIRGAFHLGNSGDAQHSLAIEGSRIAAGPVRPATSEKLVQHAREIAAAIEARAIRAADGSVGWICPTFMSQAKRFQLQAMGYNLYDGACGLALFFGALQRVVGPGEYGEVALGALRPLRQALTETRSRRTLGERIGIGGTSGLGSLAYGLVVTSAFLGEHTLVEDALNAASLITRETIRQASSLDVIDGVAGAALGLLALHRLTEDRPALDLALACGQRLLEDRTTSASGQRTWRTLEGALLTGFSHGAAGIAYALLRLYSVTGRSDFLDAAEEGMRYERSVFSEKEGNWPDLRKTSGDDGVQPRYMTSWCHGASGIGLARLGTLQLLDSTEIRRDVDTALKTTLEHGIRGADHLCCGNLGRLDFILEAAKRFDQPHLLEGARTQASQVLTRAAREGSFLLNIKPPPGMYMPGLFNGSSGIGYGLLRLAYPERLPSVLLWE